MINLEDLSTSQKVIDMLKSLMTSQSISLNNLTNEYKNIENYANEIFQNLKIVICDSLDRFRSRLIMKLYAKAFNKNTLNYPFEDYLIEIEKEINFLNSKPILVPLDLHRLVSLQAKVSKKQNQYNFEDYSSNFMKDSTKKNKVHPKIVYVDNFLDELSEFNECFRKILSKFDKKIISNVNFDYESHPSLIIQKTSKKPMIFGSVKSIADIVINIECWPNKSPIGYLSYCIPQISTSKSLSIRYTCDMKKQFLLDLSEIVSKMRGLKEFSLYYSGRIQISEKGLFKLFKSLNSRKIEKLNLELGDGNFILYDNALISLCFSLETMNSMRHLSLSLFMIDYQNEIINSLFFSISKLKKLNTLSITLVSEFYYYDHNENLARCLLNLKLLQSLKINVSLAMGMTDKGLMSICTSIAEMPYLKSLSLNFATGRVQITSQGLNKLINVVHLLRIKNLHIDINCNDIKIPSKFWPNLTEHIKSMTILSGKEILSSSIMKTYLKQVATFQRLHSLTLGFSYKTTISDLMNSFASMIEKLDNLKNVRFIFEQINNHQDPNTEPLFQALTNKKNLDSLSIKYISADIWTPNTLIYPSIFLDIISKIHVIEGLNSLEIYYNGDKVSFDNDAFRKVLSKIFEFTQLRKLRLEFLKGNIHISSEILDDLCLIINKLPFLKELSLGLKISKSIPMLTERMLRKFCGAMLKIKSLKILELKGFTSAIFQNIDKNKIYYRIIESFPAFKSNTCLYFPSSNTFNNYNVLL